MYSVDSIKLKIMRLRNELAWVNDDSRHGGPNREAQRTAILGEIGDLQRELEKAKSTGGLHQRESMRASLPTRTNCIT
jgi:hypothetical protein